MTETPRKAIRFVPMSVAAMTALLDGDLAAASADVGLELPAFFLADRPQRLWRRRVNQIAEDPASAPWVAWITVDAESGTIVAYGGFHGKPDEVGMVEIGYTVLPDYRRQGYARAMVAEFLAYAAAQPGVRVVRASISPDNAASLATIAPFGFTKVGELMDDEDGMELLLEIEV